MRQNSNKVEKRMIKSKEELLSDLKDNQDFQKKLEFAKNKFYPAVVEASKNIEDAQFFLSSLSQMMLQKFLDRMKTVKFSELGLTDILDKTDEKYESWKFALELFNEHTVFDAKDTIEGMKAELQMFINDELRERPLSSLKTKWIDNL